MATNLHTSAQWEDSLPLSSTSTGVLSDIFRMEFLESGEWVDVTFSTGNVATYLDGEYFVLGDVQPTAGHVALVDGYLTFY
jgi:hypothetical protein